MSSNCGMSRIGRSCGPVRAVSFGHSCHQLFSDDALISASCESVPAVWHVSDGAFIRSFPVSELTRFSPDGTLLAIASNPIQIPDLGLGAGSCLIGSEPGSRLYAR